LIRIKRVYDEPESEDGTRVLVDRLWPRGLTKEKARVDIWLRDVAPSDALRKWFGHEPEKWGRFKARYFRELEAHSDAVSLLRKKARGSRLTLLFAARDADHSNAAALMEYLSGKVKGR